MATQAKSTELDTPEDSRGLMTELLEQMDLERIEENLFRGQSRDLVGRRVFGGQVLGQALIAARQTVPADRLAHSIHCYFLRPGDMNAPIVYDVDRIRDGGSFTTRRVVAIQYGRAIFNMSASFQVSEPGVEHQMEMPAVPQPEKLVSDYELRKKVVDKVPEKLRERFMRRRPIEMRPVEPMNPFKPKKRPPHQYLWLRAVDRLPNDPSLHQAVLAFASDYNLLSTALLPSGLSFMKRNIQAASLDHAMWFHRDFRVDEWLLYAMDSPSSSNARGFNRGNIFSRDGRLVASVTQEGLIRLRDDEHEPEDPSEA